MMSSTIHKDLQTYYQQFSQDHDRLRAELLSSLPANEPVESEPVASFSWRRVSMAIAALVMIGFCILFVINPTAQPLNPQAAWASAMERASHVQSLHLLAETAGAGNKTTSVEIWWQRPGCVKMVWSNGNINASNTKMNYRLDKKANTVTILDGQTQVPEMIILDWFVEMFTSKDMVSQSWASDFKPVGDPESIDYKGLKCQQFRFERGPQWFDYVVDPKTDRILEAKMYNKNAPEHVMYRMEVLDLDETYPDSFFRIEAVTGQKVIHRTGVSNKSISLPQISK